MGSLATRIALTGSTSVRGLIVDTGKNFSCHDFYKKIGFAPREGEPRSFEGDAVCEPPSWIEIELDASLEGDMATV